ncbi:MAG TPA: AtpZ/AtpI family protein [Candidatus Acidoferrales bacterium]|nr:AtpZ/AtpI family protein [Candidatus Acidoferrales bacterium]
MRQSEDVIPSDNNSLVAAARYAAFGFEFAGSVVAGVVAGYYLDRYTGTSPLFLLIFTLGGMGGALYRLLWNLKQVDSQHKDGG